MLHNLFYVTAFNSTYLDGKFLNPEGFLDPIRNNIAYIVILKKKGYRVCTGLLISPTEILSAAGCIDLLKECIGNEPPLHGAAAKISSSDYTIINDIYHLSYHAKHGKIRRRYDFAIALLCLIVIF